VLPVAGCVTRVMTAVADLLGSACETAVTVADATLGMVEGAVYTPAEEIVPVVALPPLTLSTCHVTSLLPVALNASCWPSWTTA
jgi:hypothetical protein